MALETGDFITDLVPTNPPGSDPVSQGDDHLRLIKKVVQQSFPNVGGEVTLSHTELNDAALKGAANTFSELQTLIAGAVVPNNQYYKARDAGNSTFNVLGFSNSDNFIVGTNSYPTIIQGDSTSIRGSTVEQFGAGELVTRTVSRASGSLQIADSGGDFGNVAAVHKAQTFTAAQTFNAVSNFNNQIDLANNVGLRGITTSTARLTLAYINSADVAIFGSGGANNVLESQQNSQLNVAGVTSGQVVDRTSGSLLVYDRTGQAKKAGFRNPTTRPFAMSTTVTQDDEGVILGHSPNATSPGDLTLVPLEIGTTLRLFNRSAVHAVNVIGSGVTVEWLTGDGLEQGDRTIAPGGVVELYYTSTNFVSIFGNGIS